MTKEIKYQYLSSDVVFKYIFGVESNKKYAIRLIELLFDLPSIKNIKITNSVKLTPSTVRHRKFESDVVIELPDYNIIVNLEQQNEYDIVSRDKNNAYAYKISANEFKIGEEGDKKVKKVIQVNFVKRFVGVGDLEGEYELSDLDKNKKQGDRLVKIRVINVEKYRRKLYNKRVKEIDLWLGLIGAQSKEEIEIIKKKSKRYPIIKELIRDMDKFQGKEYVQELWWHDYEVRARRELAYENGKAEGRESGLLEGKQLGILEGRESGLLEGKRLGILEGRESGLEEGRMLGIAEGNIQALKEVAYRMLGSGSSLEEVNNITEIPISELRKLAKDTKILSRE